MSAIHEAMSPASIAVMVAFVVASIGAWVFLDRAVTSWRAANDCAWSQAHARREAVRAALRRNAKPAPRVSDPNEHRGSQK